MAYAEPLSPLSRTIEDWLNTTYLDGTAHMQALASSLGMSPRTLRRHLARQRTSFSAILERWRRNTAVAMLRSQDLSVQQIAKRLGYSHASNFERAFKRWTGLSPTSYRAIL